MVWLMVKWLVVDGIDSCGLQVVWGDVGLDAVIYSGKKWLQSRVPHSYVSP